MKISIVTLSFNKAQFLESAINSVLRQEYNDVEYIIVDPGSVDGSREIIERYREKVDHIVYETDTGPAEGLNHGFARATGEIYGFLNADDILGQATLSRVAHAFSRFNDADVIAAHGWLIDKYGNSIRRAYSTDFKIWRYLHREAYLFQQSTFFRPSAFKDVGGFNSENHSCWDGELWLDIAMSGRRFRIVNEFWSSFRVYENSITGSVQSNGRYRDIYERDRHRMFAKITGRSPSGISYQAKRYIAKLLKWFSNPVVLRNRVASVFGRQLKAR